jgi:hypothetical protein
VSRGEEMTLTYRTRKSDPFPTQSQKQEFRNIPTWPPRGYSADAALSPKEALEFIAEGANTFKGYAVAVPNIPGMFRFYAVMESEHIGRSDRADFYHDSFKKVSLDSTGSSEPTFPWTSLEQPSMAYCFGKYPGTTTLNYRIGKAGCTQLPMTVSAKIKPRKIKLLHILDRLRELENGLEKVSKLPSYVLLPTRFS